MVGVAQLMILLLIFFLEVFGLDVCIGKMLFRKKTNLTFFAKDYRRHFELDTETGKVCMETCFLFLLEPVFFFLLPFKNISWIYPPPRMPVANKGLVPDSLRQM